MRVVLTPLTPTRHRVRVERDDGSTDVVELDTRSFLRHDLAHFAVEAELGLDGGVWGSVSRGGSLAGSGLDGPDMDLAESLAGPVQTLMRLDAPVDDYASMLDTVVPQLADRALATRLHERVRRLRGHWAATAHGDDMVLTWPEGPDDRDVRRGRPGNG